MRQSMLSLQRLRLLRSLPRQAGLTLIELGLAILVSIFVVFAGLKVYQSTSDANTANDLTRDLAQVIATTRDLYNGQTFTGATALVLGNNGVFRGTSIAFNSAGTAANAATTRWGAFTVAAGTLTSVAVMNLTNIPASVCPKIIPKLTGSVQAIFIGANKTFDATGYTIAGAADAGNALALSNATLGTQCAAGAAASGAVDLTIIFGR